jgi:hypothetical protein
MQDRARTTFKTGKWDETISAEQEGGGKLAHAHVLFSYVGDLEGESVTDYVLQYNADGTGIALAFGCFTGRLKGKSGTFMTRERCEFFPAGVKTSWDIVPGSGTGELKGVGGSGAFEISGHGPYEIEFAYTL